MVCSLHSVTTGSRDRANVSLIIIIISKAISTAHYISVQYTEFNNSSNKCPIFGRPGSSEVPRNHLTRWDVSSIPANGIFLTKKLKTKIKMPNGWRTIKSLVHKIRLHGQRGKEMAESFSREKLRHAPQEEGG